MNVETRNQKLREFYNEGCMPILERKGKDYNPTGVAFDEIYAEAAALGLKPEQYMMVLASKHYGAIKTFCKTGNLASEPIQERLKDLANYCALMAVMLEDNK